MQSRNARIVMLILLAAAAVALFVVLQDDEDGAGESSGENRPGGGTVVERPEPRVERIEIREGAVVGGVKSLSYRKGDQVNLVVAFDDPLEEIHIHGYDEEILNPASPARFNFVADLDGVYEVEAHGAQGDLALASLKVTP